MRRYQGFMADSSRWERFALRPDDVIIPEESPEMIEVEHRRIHGNWEFETPTGVVQGGGRTLRECIDASEHAVRHHLTSVRGYEVLPEDARHCMHHHFAP